MASHSDSESEPRRFDPYPRSVERVSMERFKVDACYDPVWGFYMPDVKTIMVHDRKDCKGDRCVIHKPTAHHMRSWPLAWRADVGIFERECEHGVGHPDLDQVDYLIATGQEYKLQHGCDGCCLTE